MLTPEQIAKYNQENVETLLGWVHKTFAGVEKVVELNMQVARATVADLAHHVQDAAAAKDPQELLALQIDLIQPLAQKATDYGQHWYKMFSAVSSELSQSLESQAAETQKKITESLNRTYQNTPPAFEPLIAGAKTWTIAAQNAGDAFNGVIKQATSMTKTNLESVAQAAAATANASANAKKQR